MNAKLRFEKTNKWQQNYFFGSKSGQQELFFWAARIHILSSKYFSYRNSKFLRKEKRFLLKCMIFKID
jgi:hypothetical protein